jgi:hypothetical protein
MQYVRLCCTMILNACPEIQRLCCNQLCFTIQVLRQYPSGLPVICYIKPFNIVYSSFSTLAESYCVLFSHLTLQSTILKYAETYEKKPLFRNKRLHKRTLQYNDLHWTPFVGTLAYPLRVLNVLVSIAPNPLPNWLPDRYPLAFLSSRKHWLILLSSTGCFFPDCPVSPCPTLRLTLCQRSFIHRASRMLNGRW